MELIAEREPTARGPYAGAVGYLTFAGDLDFCITIRTAVVAGRSGARADRAPASWPTPIRRRSSRDQGEGRRAASRDGSRTDRSTSMRRAASSNEATTSSTGPIAIGSRRCAKAAGNVPRRHLVSAGADIRAGCGPGTDARALAEGRRYRRRPLDVQLAHARLAVRRDALQETSSTSNCRRRTSMPSSAFYVFGHIPASQDQRAARADPTGGCGPAVGSAPRSGSRTTPATWSGSGWVSPTCTSRACRPSGPTPCSGPPGSMSGPRRRKRRSSRAREPLPSDG